jgi:outer membrane lipoprotein-sorting protein
MEVRNLLALAGCALSASVLAPRASAGRTLEREEVVKLFSKLEDAAAKSKSFKARIRLSERSGFVLDAKPLVSEGRVWAERPVRYRKEVIDPDTGKMKSALVIGREDLWVYFPESREAQHLALEKAGEAGPKGLVESFMPWASFDLDDIEKRYKVRVRTDDVPDGVTIRRVPEDMREGEPEIESLPRKTPEEAFRIDYTPEDREAAGELRRLRIWVDGAHPWPIRVERYTTSSTVTTEISDIVLDAPLERSLFEFKPPRGTKLEELAG